MDRHHFTEKDLEFFKDFYSNYQNAQEKDEIKVLARCPDPLGQHNNGDRNNSLALDLVQNGKGPTILMKCISQECPTEEILAAKGLDFKDLYPTKNTTNPNGGLRGGKERGLEGVTLEVYAEY